MFRRQGLEASETEVRNLPALAVERGAAEILADLSEDFAPQGPQRFGV